MDDEALIKKAREKARLDNEREQQPFFVQTIAWFHYLGLIRHNLILPHRHHPHLRDVLAAGEMEPRILELLPAIMIQLPEALRFTKRDIPPDLARVLKDIQQRAECAPFRGVPPQKYCHWLGAPIMDVARRRLDFRRAPRRAPRRARQRRAESKTVLADTIREGRLKLSLTQEDFAKKYNLSLKVIRDLEQGKMTASIGAVSDILKALGRTLRV